MRNAAKGYIIQVLDHNGVFLEEDENVNHLYQVIFNTLSEGAEEDASEEDELPCILSEMILDALGSNFTAQYISFLSFILDGLPLFLISRELYPKFLYLLTQV